jgi:hypothetical protein
LLYFPILAPCVYSTQTTNSIASFFAFCIPWSVRTSLITTNPRSVVNFVNIPLRSDSRSDIKDKPSRAVWQAGLLNLSYRAWHRICNPARKHRFKLELASATRS